MGKFRDFAVSRDIQRSSPRATPAVRQPPCRVRKVCVAGGIGSRVAMGNACSASVSRAHV